MQAAANKERAQNGDKSDGEDGRRRHRKGLGECQGMEHLAFHPGQCEHGNEREDDDDHGKRDRPPDQARRIERDLPDVLAIAAVLLVVLLGLPNHVLGHHDARVNQHADGDRNAAQRHDVRRDACSFHEEKGSQHRERQRDGDHKNAAEVPEEENVRQGDEDDFFNERVAKRVNGVIDEDAAIVERNDLHVRWKPRLNFGDLLLDRVDDFARIGPIANDDHAADGLFAVLVEHAAAELRPQLHAAYVAQGDRSAVVGAQRYVFDILESADQADAAHDFFGVANLDHLGADVVVAALHSRDHILERDVVGAQLDGIEVDLVLAHEAAHAGHFSDARNGVELILDEPVLNRVQGAGVVGPFDRVPEDLPDAGSIGPHHGRYFRRQKTAGETQPFEDSRSREIDVDGVLEDDVDHREAKLRSRPHRLDMRKSLQIDGQGIGDLIFDFLRAASRPLGKHDDLVFAQIGNGVDGRVHQRPVAPGSQRGVDRHDQPPVLHREFNDSVDHFFLVPWRQ